MPSWLVEQDAKRQACGTSEEEPNAAAIISDALKSSHQLAMASSEMSAVAATQDGAQDQAAVAVTQDGAQEQPAVAGSAGLPPPPPPPPTPPPPPASPPPASPRAASDGSGCFSDIWSDEHHATPHPSNVWQYATRQQPQSDRATDGSSQPEPMILQGFHDSPAARAGGNVDPIHLYRRAHPELQQLLAEPGRPVVAADAPAVADAPWWPEWLSPEGSFQSRLVPLEDVPTFQRVPEMEGEKGEGGGREGEEGGRGGEEGIRGGQGDGGGGRPRGEGGGQGDGGPPRGL